MAAKRWSGRQFLLLVVDIGIILSSFYFALWLRTGQTPTEFTEVSQLALVVSLILSYAVSFYIFELYDTRRSFRGSSFLASMGGAFGLAFLFSITSSFIFQEKLGRAVLGISWAMTGALACGWRLVYGTLFRLQEPRRNVLILGNGETTETVIPALEELTRAYEEACEDPEFDAQLDLLRRDYIGRRVEISDHTCQRSENRAAQGKHRSRENANIPA